MTFLVGRNQSDAHVESFSGNASTTAFTLANSTTTNACVVRINGVVQRNGTDFTVSGTTITFTTAPPNSSNNVVVQYFGVGTLQVPTDASVTEVKMGSDSVSEAKLKVSNSPTNGTFLQAQSGASGGLTWAEAGGGWEFVSRTTCSSTADVSYTDLTTGYDYQVVVTNLLFGTDSQRVTAVVGVAGPTYRTSGYLAMSTYVSSASNAGGQKDTASFNPMSTSATSDANGESHFIFTLIDPANASTETYADFIGRTINTSATNYRTSGGGFYATAEANVALKFAPTSGNIATGFFDLYKRKNA